MSIDENSRYQRHLQLEGFSDGALSAIRNARVFVAGAGGLGSAVLPVLVASGVGEVVFADYDIVEVNNLHRQIIYREQDDGRKKVESALKRLSDSNSGVTLIGKELTISDQSLPHLIDSSYDLVFDCTDNFQTRYILADYCWNMSIPLISGAIVGCEGQVMAFVPSVENPCLRCLMPTAPKIERRAAQFGVFGPAVGVIGSIEAAEGVKMLAGVWQDLSQKLISYDARSCRFVQVTRKKNPTCCFCSPS